MTTLAPTALVRAATPADLPRIIAAADAVFRSPTPAGLGSMGHDYPLLFDRSNARHLMIAEDEGGILAHAGFVLCEASLAGERVRVATIGAVFTRTEHRQHGIATRVVEAVVAAARHAGAELGLVSGKRGLYERAGFGAYPACPRYRVEAGEARDGTLTVTRYTPDRLGDLMALAEAEPVRFVRSREEWQRLLGAGVVFFEPAETFVVRRGERTVAYLAVGRPTGGPGLEAQTAEMQARGARVLELAGDRAAIADAAPVVAKLIGVRDLDVIFAPQDQSFAALARGRGFVGDEVRMPFTSAWWNPARSRLPLPFYGFNYV